MKPGYLIATGVLACVVGCNPQWHTGQERMPAIHELDAVGASDAGTRLSGFIWYAGGHVPAFTDYGFKVNRVADDTGKELTLRSYRIFWAKAMRFEADFSPTDPLAKTLHIDVVIYTRSGLQRLTGDAPITRHVPDQPPVVRNTRWEPGPHDRDLTELGQKANRRILHQ